MGLRDLFRRDYAATPGPSKADLPTAGEAGKDGDSWYTHVLGGGPDVNPELTGSQKFACYDEMRKTSASIKSLLLFIKLPVRSGHWGLNPATEEPEAELVRDFVAWNVGLEGEEGQMDLSWDEQLQQALQMLDFGPMFEELVWTDPKRLVEWRDKNGDAHLTLPLDRLAPRYPQSVQSVKFERGRVSEVSQWIPGTKPIPGDKLSYLVFEREGGRWDGVSLLRPAWGPWTILKALMVAAGIGWDRFSSGHPVVYHPENEKDKEEAKAIGRNVRTHEVGYTTFPTQGVSETGRPLSGWGLELVNGAATLADPTPLLRWFADDISKTGLQHFSSLGRTDSGSRALGEVQVDPYFLAVQAVADYIRRERVRQVLRRIVAVNFGPDAAARWTPILTVSKIQARSVTVVSNAIGILAAAGFNFTDRETVDDIREMLGLPKLPDDGTLAAQGIDRQTLLGILQGLGLDSATFAAIVNALPPEIGLARNRNGTKPLEGAGLPLG